MSVIERLAKAIYMAQEVAYTWEELDSLSYGQEVKVVPIEQAKAVLQCLSDNIDEDGIIEASKAYCAANDYDRFNEVLDRKEPAWTDYTKEIAIAIQAYLKTISKE